MDFGQILDPLELQHLRMTLPSLDSAEEAVQLERLKRAAARSSTSPKIYVGAPVFSHSPWVGNFYPEETASSDYLKAYAKQLNTVELNSTFYAIPSAEIFQKWKASVGVDFRFCPKFPKSISHSLDSTHADIKIFSERVLSLEGNLGTCFLQLPHYFSMQDQERLRKLLAALPREIKTVVEFRNPEFFSEQRLKPEWVDALASSFIGSVSIDTPGERRIAHVSLTSTRVLIRFLGANLHESDHPRLKEWAERVATWHVNGMKEIYFIVHEPDNSLAPQAAEIFIEELNASLLAKRAAPALAKIQWNHLI